MDDSRISKWCLEGNEQAFRDFYREQSPKLWKFLVARGCDRDLAYDLLAEAFLKFIQNVCHDPREPVALLYRIAINLRIDAFRRDQANPTTARNPEEIPELAQFPESPEVTDIRRLVATLPESEQNFLLMRYWIGLSHKEVAQALDLPEGTVRRQCAELLTRLYERLKQE